MIDRLPTSFRLRIVTAGVVTAVWFVAWLVRKRYSSPNVDDCLYTIIARRLWMPLANGDLLGAIRAFLETGQSAPLVPALGAPLSGLGPDVVVLVQLPQLLVLTTLVFAIVDRISGAKAALIAALMTALSAPVLNWSLMVHMALASSVCTLGVIDAYLRSDGFAHRLPSVWVGIWIGLLALSRSMAPVYVSMVCTTLLLSVLVLHRRDIIKNSRNIIIGMLAAGAIAGPWYWKSGFVALHYLFTVGYSASSGFAQSGSPVRIRLETTWHEMGYALAALLLLMLAVILVERARGRWPVASQNIARETRFVLFVFAGLVMGFLSTTNVGGTAFDLPVIVTLIPALVLCLPLEGPAVKILAPAGLLVSGLAVMQACLVPGWEGRSDAAPPPLYAGEVVHATGSPRSRAAATLMDQIGEIVGEHDIFVTRDDAVVNVNGLIYLKIRSGLRGIVGAPSYDRASTHVSVPRNYAFVLSGQSCAPYHRNVDRAFLESSLKADGWSTVLSLRLSHCNDVVLWRRSPRL